MTRIASINITLAALCFCSALAVTYSIFLSRQSVGQLAENQRIIDSLDIQRSQLQIEESTFSEYGRVERTARDRLDMTYPGLDGSKMIVR